MADPALHPEDIAETGEREMVMPRTTFWSFWKFWLVWGAPRIHCGRVLAYWGFGCGGFQVTYCADRGSAEIIVVNSTWEWRKKT
jgi:hypothetical protein